jgi:hypothetical protein
MNILANPLLFNVAAPVELGGRSHTHPGWRDRQARRKFVKLRARQRRNRRAQKAKR